MFLRQKYQLLPILGVLISLQVVQPAVAFSQEKALARHTLEAFDVATLETQKARTAKREGKVSTPYLKTAAAPYIPAWVAPKPLSKPAQIAAIAKARSIAVDFNEGHNLSLYDLAKVEKKPEIVIAPVPTQAEEEIIITWHSERVEPKDDAPAPVTDTTPQASPALPETIFDLAKSAPPEESANMIAAAVTPAPAEKTVPELPAPTAAIAAPSPAPAAEERPVIVWDGPRIEPKAEPVIVAAAETEETYKGIDLFPEAPPAPKVSAREPLRPATAKPAEAVKVSVPEKTAPKPQQFAAVAVEKTAPNGTPPSRAVEGKNGTLRNRVMTTALLPEENGEDGKETPAPVQAEAPVPAPAAVPEENDAPAPAALDTTSQNYKREEDAAAEPEVRRKIVELPVADDEGTADPHSKIPVSDVVALALRSHPDISRSRATKELYEASLADTEGQQAPQITAFSNLSGEYDTSDQTNSRFDDSLAAKAGVRLNYTLYNFGASGARIDAGESTVEQAALQLEESREAVAFDVISNYLEIIRQKELLDIEQFRIDEHKDFLNLIEEAAKADQVLKSQLFLARTGLAQRKQSYINVERQLKQTVFALERLTGEKLDISHFEKPFSPIVVLPEEEEFIAMGLASSPEVRAIEKAINAAQSQRTAATKDKYGSVNVNMNVAGDRNLTAEERATEASGSVLLEYSVPLYTGGSLDSRVKQAEASMKQTEADLQQTRDTIREQLRLAYYAIQKNDEILSLSKEEESNALETLEAYKGEIAYGGRSFSDVVTQIDSVAAARGREISARISKTLAAYAIIRRQSSLIEHLKLKEAAAEAARSGS